MKNAISKTVSIVLAGVMMLSAIPVASAFAEKKSVTVCNCGYAPTIVVEGLNTKDIYSGIGTEAEKLAFPPSGDSIKELVLNKKTILGIVEFLITHNWKKFGDLLIPIANAIFADSACKTDGSPEDGSGIKWDCSTVEIPSATNHKNDDFTTFYYDWRCDPLDIAEQLSIYINRVIAATGHSKVKLVGFSMGSVITMSYISKYGCGKLDGVVFSAPAYNGVVTCGQPFALMIDVDGLAAARFLDDMLGDDEQSVMIKSLVNMLYKANTIKAVNRFVDRMIDKLGERVYNEVFLQNLSRMPGLWSLVSDEYYEKAKFIIKDKPEFADLVRRIDAYHYGVQMKSDELVKEILDSGISFGIVSKYGSQLTPCIDGWDMMGDSVISTDCTSFGATCASLEGTLGNGYKQKIDCGHNHISPDNQIDASTCKYPEYTWFVRELLHSSTPKDYHKLLEFILYSEKQPTVFDNSTYPQFMIYDKDSDKISPMTADNCMLPKSIASYSFFRTVGNFGRAFISWVKSAKI